MASAKISAILLTSLALTAQFSLAQQAVSSIEQSRLFQTNPNSPAASVTANGMALPDSSNDSSSDDSFGAQVVLKTQERVRTFTLSGDAGLYYTSNAALVRTDERDDAFFVGNAALSWSSNFRSHFQLQAAAHASIFRYDRTSALDFVNLGVGLGASWEPEHFGGVAFFGHYDFIELIDRHSQEILRDHEFTFGAQRAFAFGRAHALTVGLTGSAGVSDPVSAQRDQVGAFLGYHLQISRSFSADLLYRFAYYFYNDPARTDRNQLLSASARYRLTGWAEVNATASWGTNRSDQRAFDYDVGTVGGGLGVAVRF